MKYSLQNFPFILGGRFFGALAAVLLVVFLGCSRNSSEPAVDLNGHGSVVASISLGRIAGLAKVGSNTITLATLGIRLESRNETPIERLVPLTGGKVAQVLVQNFPELSSLKKWQITIWTADVAGKVIHGPISTEFDVHPRKTTFVSISAQSKFSEVTIVFPNIPDSVQSLRFLDSDSVLAESSFVQGALAGKSVTLRHDYLKTGLAPRQLSLHAMGSIYGGESEILWRADTLLSIPSGVDQTVKMTMKYIGLRAPPDGAGEFQVFLGRIGSLSVEATLEDTSICPGCDTVPVCQGGTCYSPTGRKAATIGPEGGTMGVAGIRVEFPVGAVTDPVLFTMTAMKSVDGMPSLQIEPSMRLLQPVTIRVDQALLQNLPENLAAYSTENGTTYSFSFLLNDPTGAGLVFQREHFSMINLVSLGGSSPIAQPPIPGLPPFPNFSDGVRDAIKEAFLSEGKRVEDPPKSCDCRFLALDPHKIPIPPQGFKPGHIVEAAAYCGIEDVTGDVFLESDPSQAFEVLVKGLSLSRTIWRSMNPVVATVNDGENKVGVRGVNIGETEVSAWNQTVNLTKTGFQICNSTGKSEVKVACSPDEVWDDSRGYCRQPEVQAQVSTDGVKSGHITATPSSINCGNQCIVGFPKNETISFSAVPDNANVIFDSWSGDCSGSANPYSLWVDKDKKCIAKFACSGQTADLSALPVTFTLQSGRDLGGAGIHLPIGGATIAVRIVIPSNMITGSGTTGNCGRGDARISMRLCPPGSGCTGFDVAGGQGQGLDICHDFEQVLGPFYFPKPQMDCATIDFTAITEKQATAYITVY